MINMVKSIDNVMRGCDKSDQILGMTETQIVTEFFKSGYGVTKARKRVNELKASAAIQSDGSMRDGQYVFWCIWWPWSPERTDIRLYCGVEYIDKRKGLLRRLDGRSVNTWMRCEE